MNKKIKTTSIALDAVGVVSLFGCFSLNCVFCMFLMVEDIRNIIYIDYNIENNIIYI